MPNNTIQHGTRQGYRHGCRNRNTCPKGPEGLSCADAANQYNRELRAAHQAARARRPVKASTQPSASRYRVLGGITRSQTRDAQGEPPEPGAWPSPDMPTFDPPESLANAEVEPDPEPANSSGDAYNNPELVITPKIRSDIEGKLGLFAAIIGMPFEAIDPFCGKVFANNCDNMIKTAIPLIVKSPGAVHFLTSTSGGWLDWIRFLQACVPITQAVYAHHLARTVSRDTRQPPDPTMPPMASDEYNYSAA